MMATTTNTEAMSQSAWVEDVWEPPMPPTDLIFDDGEPTESNRHGMNEYQFTALEYLASRRRLNQFLEP